MGIARYENVDVNNVTNGVDSLGQYTTSESLWFMTRARIHEVNNSLQISEKYRVYSDLVNMTFNFTPNMKQIAQNQQLYSITWRDKKWRIASARESDDRMRITLMCYRADPSVPV